MIELFIGVLKTLVIYMGLILLLLAGSVTIYFSKKKSSKIFGWMLAATSLVFITVYAWMHSPVEWQSEVLETAGFLLVFIVGFLALIVLSNNERTKPLAESIVFLWQSLQTAFVAIITGFLVFILGSVIFRGIWFETESFAKVAKYCLTVWGIITVLFALLEIWKGYAKDENVFLDLLNNFAYPMLVGLVTGIVVGLFTAGTQPAILGFVIGGIIGFVSGLKDIISS
ncbi:MAG: hypothetical protein RL275_2139 [Chloroflexota bacterium]|jgi:hypothetical protein